MIWYIGIITALMVAGVMMSVNLAFSESHEKRKRLIYGLVTGAIVAFLGGCVLNMVSVVNDIREKDFIEQCNKSPDNERCVETYHNALYQ